jgi:biopolymer transport protein ExbD
MLYSVNYLTHFNLLRRRLVVDVGVQGLYVDGERVVGTVFYERSELSHIEEVYSRVLRRKGEPIALRVDADVSWRVVRKVLFTLEEAGARDISFVAESRSGL